MIMWVIFMEKSFLTEKRKKYILLAMVIGGVYLFMKFLSPILSPFILAFLFAGLLSKLTDKIPVKIKKPVLAGLVLVLFVALLLIIAGILIGLVVHKCEDMAGVISCYEQELCVLLGDCCDFVEKRFGVKAGEVETYILEQVNLFAENLEVNILPSVMNKSMKYLRNIAGAAGFLAVAVIAVFLMLKDYDEFLLYVRQKEDLQGALEIAKKVIVYLKTFLKAQIIILLMIGSICAIVLGLAGIEGGIVYGIVTGFMDMLPFVGTGFMLMPLAFFQLLSGNYLKSVVIVGLYAICVFAREFLEPKLIGDRVGIWPIGILFSVFAGVKLFGIFGIIKGPIGLVIICETCKYLFKEKENYVKESG